MVDVLKAPFPAFGGKSRIASMVWPRLSREASPARNYVEPFCFSAAMLLLRPDAPQIETINDLNAFVANFWRAIQHDPEAVTSHADWPVNEVDLHARHRWLVQSEDAAERLQRVRDDAEYFDAKIAGWWCWGACMWIGSGWCDAPQQIPHISNAGQGVNSLTQQIPHMDESRGIIGRQLADAENPALTHKKPILTSDGGTGDKGVNSVVNLRTFDGKGRGSVRLGEENRPQLADAYSRGRGVHGNDELTDCDRRRLWLTNWFTRLSDRLRPVRVCCGHWARVCDSDSTLTRLGTTAVFLDPPYRKKLADGTANRASHIYANDKAQDVEALVDEVQEWSLKWGGDKDLRIAVCGLEGEYPKLDAAGWEKVAWKSQGGYGNRNKENENAARERVWFSPHCIRLKHENTLLDYLEARA